MEKEINQIKVSRRDLTPDKIAFENFKQYKQTHGSKLS